MQRALRMLGSTLAVLAALAAVGGGAWGANQRIDLMAPIIGASVGVLLAGLLVAVVLHALAQGLDSLLDIREEITRGLREAKNREEGNANGPPGRVVTNHDAPPPTPWS